MTEAEIKELEKKYEAAREAWDGDVEDLDKGDCSTYWLVRSSQTMIDAKVALEIAREQARVDAEMESERNRMRAEIERINRTLSSLLIHSLPKN